MERTTDKCRLENEKLLDEGQSFAMKAFLEGQSVALIGGAGSGKSFLLNKLIQEARRVHGDFPIVAACALSNKAADALNGITIHRLFAAKSSWEFSKEYLLANLRRKPRICAMLKRIRILIIDEISLLTSNVLDSIDYVLREFSESEWHSSLPIGGRQLIVSFDPFQLEPPAEQNCVQRDALRTCYESRMWYLTFGPPGDGIIAILATNHRQSRDNKFFEILSRIRLGKQTSDDIRILNSSSGNTLTPPDMHTRLCLTNVQAAEINERKLAHLPGLVFKSVSIDKFHISPSSDTLSTLHRRLCNVAPKLLTFKIGSRVILTRSVGRARPGTHAIVRSAKIRNSRHREPQYELELEANLQLNFETRDRGTERFIRVTPAKFHVHSFDCKTIATREQLPLIPAYALTIHRSQGLTLSHAAIDFAVANSWKPNGMAYVALSRCTSISGLWVKNLQEEFITVSDKAKKFMTEVLKLKNYEPERVWGAGSLLHVDDDILKANKITLCDEKVEIEGNQHLPVESSGPVLARLQENRIRREESKPEISTKNNRFLIRKRRFEYRAVLKESQVRTSVCVKAGKRSLRNR